MMEVKGQGMQHFAAQPRPQTCGQQRLAIRTLLPSRCSIVYPLRKQVHFRVRASHDTQDAAPSTRPQLERSSPASEGWKHAFASYGRLVLFAGAITLGVLCEKRSAGAVTLTPQVHTETSNTSSCRRGVWQQLKSATGAPVQALDHLLFPDEPIAFVGSSKVQEEQSSSAVAASSSPAAASTTPGTSQQATPLASFQDSALHVAAATVEAAPSQTISTTSAASPQLVSITALARLAAAANAVGSKLVDGLAAVSAALPAPSWPAASAAMAGGSSVAADGWSAAPGAAASSRQLRVWGYAVACLVVAVLAWQVAASVPGNKATRANKSGAGKARATAASTAPPPTDETAGMLTEPDGTTCTPTGWQPPAAADLTSLTPASFGFSGPVPASLLGKEVVGPYCLKEQQQMRSEVDTASPTPPVYDDTVRPLPDSLSGKHVVGPYCLKDGKQSQPLALPDVDTMPEAAAVEDAASAQPEPTVELGSKQQVVGPYCAMKQKPHSAAARAAAYATADALAAQAAASHDAAHATAVDEELSCVMTEEAAAITTAAVVEAALAAAEAAETEERKAAVAAIGTQGSSSEASASGEDQQDDQPLFRVGLEVSAASAQSTDGLQGALAAEAVREALVAESAAAAASVAAERAHAAAHLLDVATAEHAASAVAAAAHTAAEVAVAAAAAAEVSATALPKVEEHTSVAANADVLHKVAEAKAAEAAAAMAAMRREVLESNAVSKQAPDDAVLDVTVEVSDAELETLISEAIAAEAAAAEQETTAQQHSGEDDQALAPQAVASQAAVQGLGSAAAAAESAPSASQADMDANAQALIAEAVAAEAAAMADKLARAELIAEAIAAEAAAAADHASAEAATSAGAAGGSAGQAAEVAKCMKVQTGNTDSSSAPSTTSGISSVIPANVSVSWVIDSSSSSDDQLAALAALAAGSGHPAILATTSRSSAAMPEQWTGSAADMTSADAVLDSTDADAFKDEFAASGSATTAACAEPADTTLAAPVVSVGPTDSLPPAASLAAALDAASRQQMQQASAAAVERAQARLLRLYRARRLRVSGCASAQDANAIVKAASSTGTGPANKPSRGGSSSTKHVAEPYSHLGVSDAALALALASLDAVGPASAQQQTEQGTVSTSTSDVTEPVAVAGVEPAAGDVSEGMPDAEQAATSGPADTIAAHEEALAGKPSAMAAIADTPTARTSVQPALDSGSFTVPIIITPSSSSNGSNPYVAVADALGADNSTAASDSAFEVPIQFESTPQQQKKQPAGIRLSSEAKPAYNSSSSAGTPPSFKGFGRRGAFPRVVPKTRTLSVSKKAASASVTAARSDATPKTGGASNSADATSVPVEWLSTPNSNKRAQLHQRAAAILAEEAVEQAQQGANPAAPDPADATTEPTAGNSSVAAAIDMATAMSAAYDMPTPLLPKAAAAELPVGWGAQGPPGSCQGSKDKDLQPRTVRGGWTAVSEQLAAELEGELAELVAAAAARLDNTEQDMSAAYSTPTVRLPAATTGSVRSRGEGRVVEVTFEKQTEDQRG